MDLAPIPLCAGRRFRSSENEGGNRPASPGMTIGGVRKGACLPRWSGVRCRKKRARPFEALGKRSAAALFALPIHEQAKACAVGLVDCRDGAQRCCAPTGTGRGLLEGGKIGEIAEIGEDRESERDTEMVVMRLRACGRWGRGRGDGLPLRGWREGRNRCRRRWCGGRG